MDNLKTVTRGGYICGSGYTDDHVVTTTMNYDALGRKLDMTDPDMGRWDYSYDVTGNLVSQDDALDKVVQFVTDAYNRPLGKSLPLTASTAFVLNRYDTGTNGLGRLASVDTYAPTFSDDFNRASLGSNWSSSGTVSMDPGINPVEVKLQKQGANAIVWRPLFNLTAGDAVRFDFRVNNISGLSDEMELISNGGSYQVELLVDGGNLKARAKNSGGFTPSTILMPAQNTVQYSVLLAIGDNDWVTVQVWEKNNPGKAAQWTYPLGAAASSQLYGFQMTVKAGEGYLDNYEELDRTSGSAYTYDNRGRVSQEVRRIGSSTYTANYSYDALDRPDTMTYPGGEVVDTDYNNQGLPEALTGTSSYVPAATYNARGQTIQLSLGSGVNSNFSYHPAGDAAGGGLGDANFRLASMTAGTLLNFSYQYDKVGNVTQIADSAVTPNDTQTFTYDHLGRLLTATGTQPAYNHSYQYYPTDPYPYEDPLLGNISSRTDETGTHTYTYGASHPQAVTSVSGSPAGSFTYDANGNMTQRVEGGVTYNQVFDVENRLASVTANGQTTTFTYDANGQRVKTVLPDGTVIHYPFPHYEVRNPGQTHETSRSLYTLGSQAIALREKGLALAESFDDGDSTGWTVYAGTWSVAPAASGSHNSLYQQTNITAGVTNSARSLNQSGAMSYEWTATFGIGNMGAGLFFFASSASQSNHGNAYLVYQSPTAVEIHESVNDTLYLRASTSLGFASGASHSYRATYNPATGVIQVWRDGQAVLSWTSPSEPLSSGSFVAWRTTNGLVKFDNLRITGNPATYSSLTYLYGDHLGSTSVIASDSGQLVDWVRYLPFGSYRASDSTLHTDRGFTGHLHNDPVGLVYMNARYYVPSIGGFASADTIAPDPKNPQTFNRYSYALNSPLNYTDPTGHAVCVNADCSYVQNPSTGNIVVRNYLANSTLHRLIVRVLMGGDTAAGRLDEVLAETRMGNLPHAQFAGLGGERDDSGFKPEFQDDHLYEEQWGIKQPYSQQVGHFLTAVSMGNDQGFFRQLLWKYAIMRHEQAADGRGKIGELFGLANQMLGPMTGGPALLGFTAGYDIASFNYAVNYDTAGNYGARDEVLQGLHGNGLGNSMEDLRLSVRGWRLGNMVVSGELQTNKELATWIALNVAGD
ncbi:MAG: RHS repeat-associated core domain-containing protein [Chloroflexota bacterium]